MITAKMPKMTAWTRMTFSSAQAFLASVISSHTSALCYIHDSDIDCTDTNNAMIISLACKASARS